MNFPAQPGEVAREKAGAASAASAQSLSVGHIGFQPHWNNVADSMAASIVRLECQKDELNAEIAMLREQARILKDERDEALATVEALRDQICRDKCREKAAADGGWGNI